MSNISIDALSMLQLISAGKSLSIVKYLKQGFAFMYQHYYYHYQIPYGSIKIFALRETHMFAPPLVPFHLSCIFCKHTPAFRSAWIGDISWRESKSRVRRWWLLQEQPIAIVPYLSLVRQTSTQTCTDSCTQPACAYSSESIFKSKGMFLKGIVCGSHLLSELLQIHPPLFVKQKKMMKMKHL